VPDMLKLVQLPEDLGLSGQAVKDLLARHSALDIHALALVRDQKVYAIAKKPYRTDSPHTLFSLSKSFCSMAAGIAVDEGLIRYEDSVADILKDSLPEGFDIRLNEVTLHHLLSMSSGLDERSDQEIRGQADWARAALSYRVVHDPGSHFHYNTMGTYLAGRMVSKRTGMSLRDYLMPRLFAPLGIAKPQWDCCPLGYNVGGSGLHLSVMDLAKTAQLLLNWGLWEGRQLLSADYLGRATVKQVDNEDQSDPDFHIDWALGYGYQFWMTRENRYRGDGMFGQVMLVDEGNKLAVCVTAGTHMMGNELDALHGFMEGLLQLPPLADKAAKKLQKTGKAWQAEKPRDDGGALWGEGSYLGPEGRLVRVETPDEDHLRLIFRKTEDLKPLIFSFGRKKPVKGQVPSWAYGERPQPSLGRFGVAEGVITAQALMPEAPYRMQVQMKALEEGSIQLTMDSIGFEMGEFILNRTDIY